MNLQVDIESASADPVPDDDDIRRWIAAALAAAPDAPAHSAEISVRLVDMPEMAALNAHYRGKAGATNVLSFQAELPGDIPLPLLGDIVICVPVVADEASAQGKSLQAHWAHMAVHGTLHLLGYDHLVDDEADAMESLETRILEQLGFSCPYDTEHAREGIAP